MNALVSTDMMKRSLILALAGLLTVGATTHVHAQAGVPPKPNVKVIPGDGRVTLYWDDSAETFLDTTLPTPRNNFEGYKVYRATDPEFTDALRITSSDGTPLEYLPRAQYDRVNDIAGYHPKALEGLRFWLGEDSGISRVFEDSNLVNGRTYYYAVVAYTHGDAVSDFFIPIQFDPNGDPLPPRFPNAYFVVRPKESPIDVTIANDGSVTLGPNVVAVTPQAFAPGYIPAENPALTRVSGSAGGSIGVRIIDENQVNVGSNYRITFRDTIFPGATTLDPDLVVTRDFSLQNTTTGEFLFRNESRFRTEQLLIKEGLLVTVNNTGDTVKVNNILSRWVPANANKSVHPYQFGVATRNAKLADYRVEFGEGVVSRSEAVTVVVGALTRDLPSEDVNFRVINTLTNQPVKFGFSANQFIPRDLQDITFVTSTLGFTVGGGGSMRRTTDGGQTFTFVDLGISQRLNSVYFANATHGWAVGESGTVVRTTNGGTSWQVMPTNITRNLLEVWFLDTSTGFATSNTLNVNGQNQSFIYKTTDGGATWAPISISNSTTVPPGASVRNLNAIQFINASTGYVVGAQRELVKTTDGGVTWTRSNPVPSPAALALNAVHFTSLTNGWVAATQGITIRTVNGGTSWTSHSTGSSINLNDIWFVDTNTGWVVGAGGAIRKSTDGGVTWTAQTSGTTADLFSVRFLDANNGFAVGAGPTILRTTDGGTTWTLISTEKRFRAMLINGQARSDEIYFLEEFNNQPNQLTWKVSMLPSVRGSEDPSAGDVLDLITVKPFTSADEYTFSITTVNAPSVNSEVSESALDAIRVVPNPYVVTSVFEVVQGSLANQRQLHFTHLPQECTIRIFNVAGQLVQTLNVSNSFNTSRYVWDMKDKNGHEIPYGVYIYHVEAPGIGEKVGKFAVIK
ncbi:MAG: hypothetical protein RL177_1389 [Bacteroidota bacterium]|jgi:photosystem II stability/assembly factor-like uncharacterized protein